MSAAPLARGAAASEQVAAHLSETKALLDPVLDAAIAAEAEPASLHQAMRHLLLPGGKRLRPGFVFASCQAFGGAARDALPAAAAVELVHTYSLVHDDLPCMDDDVERRGQPTVHVAFDEATALLAGDALQALAFEVLARSEAAPAVTVGAMADLSAAAGSQQLVGGQVDDLAFAGEPATADRAARVESIHRRKSAALIAASVVMGARFGGADTTSLPALHQFGLDVGVAFQIADDLLDAEEEEEPCSSVGVLGVKKAEARAEELLTSALAQIGDLGSPAETLRQLARYAVRRDR